MLTDVFPLCHVRQSLHHRTETFNFGVDDAKLADVGLWACVLHDTLRHSRTIRSDVALNLIVRIK